MKPVLFLFLVCICTRLGICQPCVFKYDYVGDPGDIHNDSIQVFPGSLIRFDFCTYNIPDRLTIYQPYGDLVFDVGTLNQINSIPPFFRGYCEFWYEDSLQILVNQGVTTPGMSCQTQNTPGGVMRLYYRVPDWMCTLRFQIRGNLLDYTVYDICATLLEEGSISGAYDTLTYHICFDKDDHTWNFGCYDTWIDYVNESILEIPVVIQPDCLGLEEGEIHFPNHPEFDIVGIDFGLYEIPITNEFCDSTFVITIPPGNLCEYFIPNVFSPESGSNNEIFTIFTPIEYPYFLEIYDRWGSLVFRGDCISNVSGWDGRNITPGVFAYKISMLDRVLYGDVTVVK